MVYKAWLFSHIQFCWPCICSPCKLWYILQKMRRQFFSFFIPLLHLQSYRGLCFIDSMAFRHSSCASGSASMLKLPALPATHCLMVRYLVLQPYFAKHCSCALTQSSRTDRDCEIASAFEKYIKSVKSKVTDVNKTMRRLEHCYHDFQTFLIKVIALT